MGAGGGEGGPCLEPDCLAKHTACPLLKPEPHVSNPKTDLRDHWILDLFFPMWPQRIILGFQLFIIICL